MRSELLHVRLSRSELRALDRVASRFGVSRSALVRAWIFAADETSSQPLPPLPSLEEVLADFERDFSIATG